MDGDVMYSSREEEGEEEEEEGEGGDRSVGCKAHHRWGVVASI